MTILEKNILYSPENILCDSYDIKIEKADILKIQISGEGSCDIKIYGKLSSQGTDEKICVVNDADYSITNEITKSGIYTISCECYYSIKIEVISTDNNMSCLIVKGAY